jgi:predicted LPLAT superfamily acyltransferase
MQRWEGKSLGNKLGYRIFFFICKNIGVYPSYFVLVFVALYYVLFSRSSTKVIYRYFRVHHKYNKLKSLINSYRNYYVFGQTLIDKVIVMAGIQNKFTYFLDGESNLRGIVKQGKGGLLISAHLGNWEMASEWFDDITSAINIVMLDAEHQQIKDYINSITKKRTYNIIPIKSDMSHIYDIAAAFQRNELVCMHADRFLPGNKTMRKTFLSGQAQFPLGPFIIAATFRVPVSFVFAFKESLSHYHFFGSAPVTFDRDVDRDQVVESLLNTFISSLEKMVKKYPTQWFNYYDFWE